MAKANDVVIEAVVIENDVMGGVVSDEAWIEFDRASEVLERDI
ncbi:hypothetical protein [Terasakiispira papahanaumokuakeensis]|nr:hypothetical protein [Terasakiispira papahanaumokuakeensis]